jgi:outer membrane lipoprotein-sorting protein
MRSFSLLLALLLVPTAALTAERPVLADENIITNPAADPAWSPLFAELGKPRNRFSRFEEHRIFPFRNRPLVLEGEIRIVPNRGLSLSYSGEKPHVIIIDDKGVLMRDERGRERSAPDDSRARGATSALSHILRFDLPALEKDFEVHGLRDGDAWTLGFVPRDPNLTKSLGTIIVRGKESQLERIEMLKSDDQRIEILIKDSQADVIFTMDVLKRFFR